MKLISDKIKEGLGRRWLWSGHKLKTNYFLMVINGTSS
jgi:hypothetical protein